MDSLAWSTLTWRCRNTSGAVRAQITPNQPDRTLPFIYLLCFEYHNDRNTWLHNSQPNQEQDKSTLINEKFAKIVTFPQSFILPIRGFSQNLSQLSLLIRAQARREVHIILDDEVASLAGLLGRHPKIRIWVLRTRLCWTCFLEIDILTIYRLYCSFPACESLFER